MTNEYTTPSISIPTSRTNNWLDLYAEDTITIHINEPIGMFTPYISIDHDSVDEYDRGGAMNAGEAILNAQNNLLFTKTPNDDSLSDYVYITGQTYTRPPVIRIRKTLDDGDMHIDGYLYINATNGETITNISQTEIYYQVTNGAPGYTNNSNDILTGYWDMEIIEAIPSTSTSNISYNYVYPNIYPYTVYVDFNSSTTISSSSTIYFYFLKDITNPLTNADIKNQVSDWSSGNNDRITTEETYGHIIDWDVSSVTDMSSLFQGKTSFNEDISGWDTSQVTDMSVLFNAASAFDQDISGWTVSSVTDMSNMFNGATLFNQDISGWNVSLVTDMNGMFNQASAFDQDISDWTVSLVTDMSNMFNGATAFNQDISGWTVSSVTDMSGMFFQASAFNQPGIISWNVDVVTNFTGMFTGSGMVTFTGDNAQGKLYSTTGWVDRSNEPYGDWFGGPAFTTTSLKNGVDIWVDDSSLTINYYGYISTWNTSSVDDMSSLFQYKTIFNEDISDWDVSSVTDMNNMFNGATAFNQDISGWDVSLVTNMNSMFNGTTNFNQPLIRLWNVSKVEDFENIFASNASLQSYAGINANHYPYPLFLGMEIESGSWFITSPFKPVNKDELVFALTQYFDGDTSYETVNNTALTKYDDISQWETSQVTDMSDLFNGATAFNEDISGWHVSSVNDMSNMFNGASAFDQDISGWTVSLVTDMSNMFNGATAFNQPGIITWNVDAVTNFTGMFTGSDIMVHFTGDNAQGYLYDGSDWVDRDSVIQGDWFGGPEFDNASIQNGVDIWVTDSSLTTNYYGYISDWDVSSVTDMSSLFQSKTSFNEDISGWDVSSVTDMSGMFFQASAFNQDISGWNVSSVTDMSSLFQNSRSFNEDISGWDVSSVTTMYVMFDQAIAFNQDISGWNVSNVTYMTYMFNGATAFNGNISSWDVSSVTFMNFMFANTNNFNQDISNWDTSNVITMQGMFSNAIIFNQDISSWDVSSLENMSEMFYKTINFDQDISSWDVSLVKNMSNMFNEASAFNQPGIITWNVDAVTNFTGMFTGSGMVTFTGDNAQGYLYDGSDWVDRSSEPNGDWFGGPAFTTTSLKNGVDIWVTDSSLTTNYYGYISDWDVSSVTDMSSLFQNKSSFNEDISSWDVSSVTNMYDMFDQAIAFNQDISGWDVSNVTYMTYMFNGATAFNGNISSWDVSSVTFMQFMFADTNNFNQDISNWDTSNVITMQGMFYKAIIFNQDISSWDVSSLENMSEMFYNAIAFNQDISVWTLSSVTDMNGMFNGASAFDQDISSWDVSLVKNMSNMFNGATAFNQDISGWTVSLVTDMSNMFNGATAFNQPGIITWNVDADANFTGMFTGSGMVTFTGDNAQGYLYDGSDWVDRSSEPNGDWFGGPEFNDASLKNGVAIWVDDSSLTINYYGYISDWDVSSVTDMSSLFQGKTSFNDDISDWDVSSVTDMNNMFNGATAFNQDISGWTVSLVTDMSEMFMDARIFNVDISAWNTSAVTNMYRMFMDAIIFNQDLSWDVSLVTNMISMFYGATAFNGDISSWDVSNVTHMQFMFYEASVFNADISSWDVSNVTDMSNMFNGASNFNIGLPKWNVENVTDMTSMFNNATNFNQDIRPWIVSETTNLTNMFNNCGITADNVYNFTIPTPLYLEFGIIVLITSSDVTYNSRTNLSEINITFTLTIDLNGHVIKNTTVNGSLNPPYDDDDHLLYNGTESAYTERSSTFTPDSDGECRIEAIIKYAATTRTNIFLFTSDRTPPEIPTIKFKQANLLLNHSCPNGTSIEYYKTYGRGSSLKYYNNVLSLKFAEDVYNWEYSTNKGVTFTSITGNASTTITLDNGIYLPGSIIINNYDDLGNESSVTNVNTIIIKQNRNGNIINKQNLSCKSRKGQTIRFYSK